MGSGDILERKLPGALRNKALISPSGDYGWQKEYIYSAIDEIQALKYAIIGCEVWAVVLEKDENTLAAFDELFLTVSRVYVNKLPCRNGKEELFKFACDKSTNETWQKFIQRAADETKEFINSANIEAQVDESLSEMIFYNPVFIDKIGYNSFIY